MNDMFENHDDLNLIIRLATISDAHGLARSRYDFRSSLSPACESEVEFIERCSLWMRERLKEDSLWRCWIAEQDQTIVGNLWMQLIEKIPNPIEEPERHAYITNFYIREEARGKGIGSKMLAAALEYAKTKEVEAVILWPTLESRSLYLRHGFAVRENLLERMMTEADKEQ